MHRDCQVGIHCAKIQACFASSLQRCLSRWELRLRLRAHPDGDVYFGVMSNPDNGSRGFLLRFRNDLSIEKVPGGFGWDYTAAIVPATMVPSYSGRSSYLIFSKYNNYAIVDSNGVNRIALLDPNATQLDPHSSAKGLVEMREVLTVLGPTPDQEFYSSSYPFAVREWCINTAAVNPPTNSIFTPSEWPSLSLEPGHELVVSSRFT